MARRVIVFLNRKSGSASGTESSIQAGFQTLGVDCSITPIRRGMDVRRLAREAAAHAETTVVSAGGDGTVNAIAAGVAGTNGLMGVLPLGTLNHFAKDLGLPLALKQAIATIVGQHRSQVDTAEVNGHLFVNNSSVGIYAEMVRSRRWLQRSGTGKWISLLLASARAVLRFHQIDVRLTVDGSRITRRTPILFVGNNEYCIDGLRIGSRERLNSGALFVYLTPGLTRWGMLRIAVAALFGWLREFDCFEQFCVTELTVDLRRRVCRVSLDGELRHINGPLHYSIRPASLSVCTPAPEGR